MIVVHVPHSTTLIPDDVRQQIVLDDEQLANELLCMTDRYVDELFALPASEARAIAYPVSRLVCDPERFESDAEEPMAQRGMGVIYTATHTLSSCARRSRRPNAMTCSSATTVRTTGGSPKRSPRCCAPKVGA